MSKLKYLLLLICGVALLSLNGNVWALETGTDPLDTACTGEAANSPVCQGRNNENPVTGSNGVLIKATNIVAIATAVTCIIMLIIAGIKYTTSQGESSKVQSARNTIIYSLVGLVVAFLARSLIVFIVDRL